MDEGTKAINHFSVLMEQQNSKLDGVLEAVRDLPTRTEFNELRQDVTELKQDVKVVRAAVTATNRDLAEHKSLPVHAAHGRA